jgi:hypothetical protein
MEEEALALSHAGKSIVVARAREAVRPQQHGERVEPREIHQRVDLARSVGKF